MPTPVRNPPLFPSSVAQFSLAFDVADSTDLAEQFPGILLPESLGRAVRKRQAEFLAGRYCVREALRARAPEHAETPIEMGQNREPLWPPGIAGAITHTHGFASACVALASDTRGIGLDAERVMTDDLATRLLDKIATNQEIAALTIATGWSVGVALTVVFSAKESIFKCLYPQVQRYFDFHDAKIVAANPAEGRFSARLLTTLTPALVSGYEIEGRFECGDGFVCTAILLPP